MTEAREAAIYQRLEQLTLNLDMQTERGPTYLMDKLLECRRLQDETVQLLNEVRRARAQVKIGRRAQQAILSLQPTDVATRAAVREQDDRYDSLTALESCVNSIRRNLSQTDSDIRLGAKLVEHTLKLGPIKNSASDAAMTNVPGTDPGLPEVLTPPALAPITTMPFDAPEPAPVPEAPIADVENLFLFQGDPAPAVVGAAAASIEDIDKFLSGEI